MTQSLTWIVHSRRAPSWTRICSPHLVSLWAVLSFACRKPPASPRCTSPQRRKTDRSLMGWTCLNLCPIHLVNILMKLFLCNNRAGGISDGIPLLLTSSIYECKMVATALMMSSTLGFSSVEPMCIEFIVDDFLSSIISPLWLLYWLLSNIYKFKNEVFRCLFSARSRW